MRLEVERGIDQIGSIYQFSPATEVGPFFWGCVNCKHSVASGFNRQLESLWKSSTLVSLLLADEF